VRRESQLSSFGSVAKPALAGLLVLLLLVAAAFSGNVTLHRSLHSGNGDGYHLCLICSLAKGQFSAAETGLFAVVLFLRLLLSDLRPGSFLPLPSFDYRLPPSRAPPRH
jgi:hypothetical protein